MKKFLILFLFLASCGGVQKDDCKDYLKLATTAKDNVCIEYDYETFCLVER